MVRRSRSILPRLLALLAVILLRGIAPLALVGLSLLGSGCSRIMGPKPGGDPIPDYPEGPAGLEALFSDILAAAKADERARVHDLFASLKLTRPELDQLFGTGRAAELAPAYEEMMGSLINRGAVEIVGVVYEKKYDTVEVFPVPMTLSDGGAGERGDGGSSELRAEDLPLARALVAAPPIYAVRFKKAGAALGTRYDFLFYSGGRWRTGNQLGKIIAKREREQQSASPPTLPSSAGKRPAGKTER